MIVKLSWTNRFRGYRVDGTKPYACWTNKMHKVHVIDRATHYVFRADYHYTKAYGLYYWNIQTCTNNSEDYLLHGPYFHLYARWNIRKFHVISRLTAPNTACGKMIIILWMLRVCTIPTPNLEPIAPRPMCWIYHTSIHTHIKIYETAQILCDLQNTWPTTSRRLNVILGKPIVCTIITPNLGRMVERTFGAWTMYAWNVCSDSCAILFYFLIISSHYIL